MSTVTVYGCNLGSRCRNALALLFEPWPKPQTISVNCGPAVECETSLAWDIQVSAESEIVVDTNGIRVLRIGSCDYTANQVLALADLNLNGFAILAGLPQSK